MIWLKFVGIQLLMLLATVLGWFILLPFCWVQAWKYAGFMPSVKDGYKRGVDRWCFDWLNVVYGNPEDGVSGQTALVWTERGEQEPYDPTPWRWLNAYLWSAWRNSCDNLKYVFADPKGPLVEFRLFSRTGKIGWQMENGYNVPVFSL